MNTQEIRDRFVQFFTKNGHVHIPSSSLIPQNDPTLLFANAGMNQFKDYFTGKMTAPFKRAVTVQKCVRAGGKHNDLENVGHTARHHTFFEMLGNFSFGDYFKDQAIAYAWEFLTVDLKIPPHKLFITIYKDDDEAFSIWNRKIGIPAERIFRKDKDNFWEMGEFGPCGPCSEIFFDYGEKYAKANFVPQAGQDLLDDDQRFVEIWNLVFMQFEKTPTGTHPLPNPCIDTGSGLERLAAAIQGVYWNYHIDSFQPIFRAIEKLTHKKYGVDAADDASMRVVADHIRACSMLITDGVIPSNEGRGYVLRRIIRRAIRHLRKLQGQGILFYQLVPAVMESLGGAYPENLQNAPLASKFLEIEERKFLETLDLGMKYLEECLQKEEVKKQDLLPGALAFKLYDTFGFPLDLTENILQEKGLALDHQGYVQCMQQQKENSRKSWKGSQQADEYKKVYQKYLTSGGTTKFTGYHAIEDSARLLAVHHFETFGPEGEEVFALIFNQTPFYAESGGQIGDHGTVMEDGRVVAHIFETQRPIEGLIVHYSKDAGALRPNDVYQLHVHKRERELLARNHSATHLLQAALIKTLGAHIKQAGSLVKPDKLRFDFTHFSSLSKQEIKKVEDLVNEQIMQALPVSPVEMPRDQAQQLGAIAFFGEKYGEQVRVVRMGDFSIEFCGGTHVLNTSEIGLITILTEQSISNGVRRIEAITSETAMARLQERSQILSLLEQELNTRGELVVDQVKGMKTQVKDLQRLQQQQQDKLQAVESEQIFAQPEKLLNGQQFKVAKVSPDHNLRKLSDLFVQKFPEGILLLYTQQEQKVSLLLKCHKDLGSFHCAKTLQEILPMVNGNGGGRPDMAQGQGTILDEKVLEKIIMIIRQKAANVDK